MCLYDGVLVSTCVCVGCTCDCVMVCGCVCVFVACFVCSVVCPHVISVQTVDHQTNQLGLLISHSARSLLCSLVLTCPLKATLDR